MNGEWYGIGALGCRIEWESSTARACLLKKEKRGSPSLLAVRRRWR